MLYLNMLRARILGQTKRGDIEALLKCKILRFTSPPGFHWMRSWVAMTFWFLSNAIPLANHISSFWETKYHKEYRFPLYFGKQYYYCTIFQILCISFVKNNPRFYIILLNSLKETIRCIGKQWHLFQQELYHLQGN